MAKSDVASVTPKRYEYHIRSALPSDILQLPNVENSAAELFRSDLSLAVIADDEPMSVGRHKKILKNWNEMGVGEGGTWVAVATPLSTSDARKKPAKREQQERGEGKKTAETVIQEDAEMVVGFVVTSLEPVFRRRMSRGSGPKAVAEAKVARVGIHREDDEEHHDSAENFEPGADSAKLYFLHINELSVHTKHQRKGLASRLLDAVKECAERLSVPPSLATRSLQQAKIYVTQKQEVMVVSLSLTTMRDVPFNAPFYKKLGFQEVKTDRIEETVGTVGVRIWEADQKHFANMDGGNLRERRCFMICNINPSGLPNASTN